MPRAIDVLYGLISRNATWLTVALLLIVGILLASRLQRFVRSLGQNRLLDVRLWYSAEAARQFFEAIGDRGRRAYVIVALTVDMVYPLVYGMLLATLMVPLYSRELGRALILVPLITVIADILENLTLAHLAWWFRGQASALTPLAATFTLVKWLTLAASLLIVIFGVLHAAFPGWG